MTGLAKGSAPAVIAIAAIEIGGGVVDVARGRARAGHLAAVTGRAVVRGGGGWFGGFLGSLICPGFGTFFGALVGSGAGGYGLSKL
jgi:hypothetical protein